MKRLSLKDIASEKSAEDFIFELLEEMQRTKAWAMDPDAPTILHQAMARWELLPEEDRAYGFLWDAARLWWGVGRFETEARPAASTASEQYWSLLALFGLVHKPVGFNELEGRQAILELEDTQAFHLADSKWPVREGSLTELFEIVQRTIYNASNENQGAQQEES